MVIHAILILVFLIITYGSLEFIKVQFRRMKYLNYECVYEMNRDQEICDLLENIFPSPTLTFIAISYSFFQFLKIVVATIKSFYKENYIYIKSLI
jgi:hypothetical protein